MHSKSEHIIAWGVLGAVFLCLALGQGCLRYWNPPVPPNGVPCSVQGDCWVDGGWMRPDGSYIVIPRCTVYVDGAASYGPLDDGGFAQCPSPACPWDCVGNGETPGTHSTIEVTPYPPCSQTTRSLCNDR
jgi:hypothetical protein